MANRAGETFRMVVTGIVAIWAILAAIVAALLACDALDGWIHGRRHFWEVALFGLISLTSGWVANLTSGAFRRGMGGS